MFLYVFLRFPVHTRQGRAEQKSFCRILERDGFSRLHQGFYVRYCSTLQNAHVHKQRVQAQIPAKCQVSIIFTADRQQTCNYHYWGNRRLKKINGEILSPHRFIEFF